MNIKIKSLIILTCTAHDITLSMLAIFPYVHFCLSTGINIVIAVYAGARLRRLNVLTNNWRAKRALREEVDGKLRITTLFRVRYTGVYSIVLYGIF